MDFIEHLPIAKNSRGSMVWLPILPRQMVQSEDGNTSTHNQKGKILKTEG